ncbi:hypothetical protein, partial [Clostridium sp. KLE 1755]|uniref:hypothetical protein n=1 Tax=Clostridium sp. KLE 1755 TaxID=1226325 RepID=UPI001A9A3163
LQPAAFVRQAAKGGMIPASRGGKKYLRFFQWSRKHPHRIREEGRPVRDPAGKTRRSRGC